MSRCTRHGLPQKDSLTRCRRTAAEAVGFDPKPRVHDFRLCWFTNAVRSSMCPHIADAILGQGDKKKYGVPGIKN
jgi:hypothetical protein